jgi:hypothetical protein
MAQLKRNKVVGQLGVQMFGDDIQASLEAMSREVFGDMAIKKSNNLINKSMGVAAKFLLPIIKSGMSGRINTGVSQINVKIKRLKARSGGGFRITGAKREELADMYPNAMKSKSYYPAVNEYKYGDMRKAFFGSRDSALDVATQYLKTRIEKILKKHRKKIAKGQI